MMRGASRSVPFDADAHSTLSCAVQGSRGCGDRRKWEGRTPPAGVWIDIGSAEESEFTRSFLDFSENPSTVILGL